MSAVVAMVFLCVVAFGLLFAPAIICLIALYIDRRWPERDGNEHD